MMDFSGTTRGYCFVTYSSRTEARRAIRDADDLELRPGRRIGVCPSVDNCRLFVGGLPRHRRRDEILVEMRRLAEGVRDVIVYPDARDKSRNRGFAFVEFSSHGDAAKARRNLIGAGIQLWGQTLAVDWAEPEAEPDDDVMNKVGQFLTLLFVSYNDVRGTTA
jgi:RNA recognition motif-containing protein